MERKVATRGPWRDLLPIGEHKERLSFERTFTKAEYDLIAFGPIPLDMDDKWFIFLENDWLYFHRSWTGKCVYQARLERIGDLFTIVETWIVLVVFWFKVVDLAYESAVLAFLIDNFLLGKSVPFPLPKNFSNDSPKGALQHNISGSAYPEKPFTVGSGDES
jgi:hypothetical protein